MDTHPTTEARDANRPRNQAIAGSFRGGSTGSSGGRRTAVAVCSSCNVAASALHEEEIHRSGGRKIHCGSILVVDDDPGVRALIASVLDAAGHSVREASTGDEALVAASEETPDLVVLDVCLPRRGGYSLLRDLRTLVGPDLPVVFVSGERTDPLDSASGLLLGADDYIVKPFHPEELRARVERLLPKAAPVAAAAPSASLGQLTPREHEVLILLARGLDQTEIAGDLVISEKTVETHIQRILAKLDVHSRAQAVAVAYCDGLVRADERSLRRPRARRPSAVDVGETSAAA
ncbi:MAG TPA: response regulator transcription factor [Gaiellaceae bacterium]